MAVTATEQGGIFGSAFEITLASAAAVFSHSIPCTWHVPTLILGNLISTGPYLDSDTSQPCLALGVEGALCRLEHEPLPDQYFGRFQRKSSMTISTKKRSEVTSGKKAAIPTMVKIIKNRSVSVGAPVNLRILSRNFIALAVEDEAASRQFQFNP